jgi:colanic acid biosynthesis glycosyl transferase WcaI
MTRIVVLCPHFAPDAAPTGTVMTRIVAELVARGHEVHVVSALPWYRLHAIEPGWEGRVVRRESTSWGSISRVHPFPGPDKTNLARRAIGFVGYSALAGLEALRVGGVLSRVDAVIAMSPPLTLGLTGWIVSRLRRGALVFNIQDVFPDAAIETGAISNPWIIRAARRLEAMSYRCADAITVLSEDLADNVRAKLPRRNSAAPASTKVHVIPNFVDIDAIVPEHRLTAYRAELGLGDGPVVLYAGNIGFSQSLDLLLEAARLMPDVQFLINGEGSARQELQARSAGLPNVLIAGYVDAHRLSELLATGDVHVVPLKRGLARVSVPSKTYSIMAAARPVLASIDPGTAVPRILAESGGGVAVPPEDVAAFVVALRAMLADPTAVQAMGERGRAWVERHASPAAVGDAYHQLIETLAR